MAIDPIEKKPLYHFLPNSKAFSIGTVGCNFRCPFCQNWRISQTANIDRGRYFSPEEIVKLAVEHRSDTIAFTYNEPTIFYPYARDIAIEAKRFGIKSIFVTNGYESKEVVGGYGPILLRLGANYWTLNSFKLPRRLFTGRGRFGGGRIYTLRGVLGKEPIKRLIFTQERLELNYLGLWRITKLSYLGCPKAKHWDYGWN